MNINWDSQFSGAITVCDPQGIILDINEKAAEMYADDGGRALIGSNALDCHPSAAREVLARILAARQANIYTIEKKGVKKMIYQAPWFENGQYAGFVELALEIPFEIPHFLRK